MQSHTRNFCIIAHIDHGKSTLADRLLEITGTVEKRQMQEQLLDSNPIERERGITIKLAPVRMMYKQHLLNLIDTPGHVDFSYEVSRSLAACEGAVLLVDATQGVQAQTLSHAQKAQQQGLTIVPAINKIDLPNARIEETARELESLGFSLRPPLLISAKTGQGVGELLDAIVRRIPPPGGRPDKPLRALVFSSLYDPHKGVIVLVRVVDGALASKGLAFLGSGATFAPLEVGHFTPEMTPSGVLQCGEVGYIATGLKDIRMAKVGDTITTIQNSNFKIQNEKFKVLSFNFKVDIAPLPGYKEPKPMVFLGLFPVDSSQFQAARSAMEKLRLSDAAFTFKPTHSSALGNGFHCGFLGLLHAEIVQERLVREFGITMIATAPSVAYRLIPRGSHPSRLVQSAGEFPDQSEIEEIREPVMQAAIFTPSRFVGAVMQLAQEKRGELVDHAYRGNQAELTYRIPLAELIVDFFDLLKSATEGYASLDYAFFDYQPVRLVKVDILVNKEKVDALSFLVVEEAAYRRARRLVEALAQLLPRQQFAVPIQAAIGGTIIARADIKAFRKDVTGKLYGGDRTRKDKLLDKQKKGKEKMKMVGRVQIPREAFFAALKRQ